MSRLVASVTSLGGVARRDQLIVRGFSGHQLSAAVHAGDLERLRRGYYASSVATPSAREAVRLGGRLAGLSAGASYGLWAGADDGIHVAVPRNASRLRGHRTDRDWVVTPSGTAVELHWDAFDSAHRECWRVSMSDCLRQVLAWEDRETAIACLESAAPLLRLSVAEIRMRLLPTPLRASLRLALLRDHMESGLETLVRLRLDAASITAAWQQSFSDVGRVDFVLADSRVIVEVDGFAFHSDRDAFERDRARDAELIARGWVVIRLTARRVHDDWPRCLGQIRRAMAHSRRA